MKYGTRWSKARGGMASKHSISTFSSICIYFSLRSSKLQCHNRGRAEQGAEGGDLGSTSKGGEKGGGGWAIAPGA